MAQPTKQPHDDDDEAAKAEAVATAAEALVPKKSATPASECSTERIILEAQNELELYDRDVNVNSHEIISHRLEEHNHRNKVSDLDNDQHHDQQSVLSPTCTTDTDSALSSAPSSLSPQPASCPNSPDLWNMVGLHKFL